ncbi:MAG: P-loop NTPase [Bacteroidota bacterium]|nr:P-loop NTPase [Rhodothermia bacterium]MCS7154866.1 P-loop NTPase [Bacteroidota bacterium]MDW8137660.1 P-loop NTPase [Bacteroidota bacterium]MDW8285386.1 P-loop NTPase [Bacteroidota bacterium]
MIIAIASGKGGTGKTLIATYLAETLTHLGRRVVLLDGDWNLANCAMLLNESPRWVLEDYLMGRCGLEDVFHKTAGGFTLLTASRGGPLADPETMLEALDMALETAQREAEFVLLDTPAGMETPVFWALERAHMGLIVLLGDPAAVADAYRLVKHVYSLDPEYPFALVVNGAESEGEAQQIGTRFNAILEHFLGRTLPYAGYIAYDPELRRAALAQEVLVRSKPEHPTANCFRALADRLLAWRQALLVKVHDWEPSSAYTREV